MRLGGDERPKDEIEGRVGRVLVWLIIVAMLLGLVGLGFWDEPYTRTSYGYEPTPITRVGQ